MHTAKLGRRFSGELRQRGLWRKAMKMRCNVKTGCKPPCGRAAEPNADTIRLGLARFEEKLKKEKGNTTLPDEPQAVGRLVGCWNQYLHTFPAVLDAPARHTRGESSSPTGLLPSGSPSPGRSANLRYEHGQHDSAVDGLVCQKREEAKAVITIRRSPEPSWQDNLCAVDWPGDFGTLECAQRFRAPDPKR